MSRVTLPEAGEEFRFVDELCEGDLCYFDRDWDGSWVVRRLDDLNLWRCDRPLFTLQPGDDSDSCRLRALCETEIAMLILPECSPRPRGPA